MQKIKNTKTIAGVHKHTHTGNLITNKIKEQAK